MKAVLYSLTFATAAIIAPAMAHAQISLSIGIAPPALPVYAQPPIPGDGYMWTPGYWSWSAADNDYYWVPGTWVSAPFVGALWTPGYWGWGGSGYAWHGGYWGNSIGYYGGINYGFGYGGVGYQGGHWDNGAFNYNRSVNNIASAHIAHVYNARVNTATVNRVSYNGGVGGIQRQPTKAEESVANAPHTSPTGPQAQHEQAARSNQDLRASVNHGMPKIAATPEPGAFNAPNAVAARAAAQPAMRPSHGNPQPKQQAQQPPQHAPAPHPQAMERAAPQENARQQPHPAAPHENAARPPEEEHHEK
jgi:hypothetical protein